MEELPKPQKSHIAVKVIIAFMIVVISGLIYLYIYNVESNKPVSNLNSILNTNQEIPDSNVNYNTNTNVNQSPSPTSCTKEYCSQFRYGNCPDICEEACVSSFCSTDSSGAVICTTDCGGEGGCYCEDANTSTDAVEIVLTNGTVPNICQTDDDCTIINKTLDLSNCCVVDYCPDYSDDKYVGINKTAYDTHKQSVEPSIDCDTVSCAFMPIPMCIGDNNDQYSAECVNNECQKVLKN